tara:strand:+ start:966 stop:1082 length:117 start_codon:yes stop_codon:yes gene_type:complete
MLKSGFDKHESPLIDLFAASTLSFISRAVCAQNKNPSV